MTIQIGDKTFATRRPQDLDAKLLATTGCSAVEAQRWLRGAPRASHVAAALIPFLPADAPPVQELAAMIDAAGTVEVAGQVATLYAAVPAIADAPVAATEASK